MQSKMENGKWALILGGLTLILFSSKPYILDLIEPSKSLGQVIGENAKDLIDGLSGEKKIDHSNSKREIWSNIIRILSFILLATTIVCSAVTFQKVGQKWHAIGGGLLAIIGLGVYFSHLAIGLIGFIVIAILVVIVVSIESFK